MTQPASIVARGGQAVTFGVTAASDTMVNYQWTRNGTAIAAATASTYTLGAAQLADSGAKFAVTVTNNAGATQSNAATLTVNAGSAQAATAARPFSDQSFWNSRPTQFTLGTYQIPSSYYYPTVAEGNLSVGGFPASASDGPVTVMGPVGGYGVYVPDAETYVPQVTIPHWPSNVVPASGGDGEADVIDVPNNRIHSFYQLRQDANGQWRASQYTWTALDGRGFGTPGEYFQGSRATGVVPIAGLIRTAEINDGLPAYKHALAMSLMTTALSGNPTYTFPATSADVYSSINHTGSIPEGALMMLPSTFDLSKIQDPRLQKIVRTLQTYGAYVVDENTGTPFIIYVELGSGYNLMPNGWDGEVAAELDLIRSSLRQATCDVELGRRERRAVHAGHESRHAVDARPVEPRERFDGGHVRHVDAVGEVRGQRPVHAATQHERPVDAVVAVGRAGREQGVPARRDGDRRRDDAVHARRRQRPDAACDRRPRRRQRARLQLARLVDRDAVAAHLERPERRRHDLRDAHRAVAFPRAAPSRRAV